MGTFSQYYEKLILEQMVGKSPSATRYVALLTVVPTSADTGATITEATYGSYARKSTVAADWNNAVAGSPSTISNANAITFVMPTSGTSTIIAFALLDVVTIGAGNVLGWGTTPTIVLSTSQGPANFAAGTISATSS